MTEKQLLTFSLEWSKSGNAMRFLIVSSRCGTHLATSIASVLEVANDEVVLVSPSHFSAVKNFRWGAGLEALLEHWEIDDERYVDAYLIKSAPKCEQYDTMLSLLCSPHWKLMLMPEELALCSWLRDGSLQVDALPEPQSVQRLSDEQLKTDFTQLLQLLKDGVVERAIHATIEERITAGWQ